MRSKKIVDDLRMGRLSRRDLGKMMAAAGVSLAFMPVGGPAKAAGSDLVYYTWSGYDLPGFHPGYVAKHGESPTMTLFSDEEEALQKLRAGFDGDVTHPCSGRIKRWRDAGVIQPMDTSRLSNWENMFPTLKGVNGADADGQQWFAAVDWGNTALLYRSDEIDFGSEPASWSVLWDEKYAGRISMGNDITDTGIITGLMADAGNPYAMTDEEMARVRELMVKQRPLVRFYWTDTTELETAMAAGEVVAAPSWNSSILQLRKAGVPAAYAFPKEGALAWVCGLIINANATHIDEAHDLIDAMLAPEAGQWLITEYGYGHSNMKAFDLMSDEDLADRGLPRDPNEMFQKSVFSSDNQRLDELQQMFEEVKAGL